MFYYIVNDGITYLCMGDDAKSARLPFTFLKDIQVRYIIGTANCFASRCLFALLAA
jgi:Regulated-SNARE-like domain